MSAPLSPPPPETEVDSREHTWAEELSRRAAADARAWFDARCPPMLHPSKTDWSHPGLAPCAAQIARVRGWTPASEGGKGLLLSGVTGRGKSRAFYALAERIRALDCPRSEITLWHSHDFFSALQDHVSFGSDDAGHFVRRQAREPFFFLDDFGQHALLAAKKEWAEGWWFRLLDLRLGAGLPVFITTNLTAAEMAGGSSQVRADPMLRRLLELGAPVRF